MNTIEYHELLSLILMNNNYIYIIYILLLISLMFNLLSNSYRYINNLIIQNYSLYQRIN